MLLSHRRTLVLLSLSLLTAACDGSATNEPPASDTDGSTGTGATTANTGPNATASTDGSTESTTGSTTEDEGDASSGGDSSEATSAGDSDDSSDTDEEPACDGTHFGARMSWSLPFPENEFSGPSAHTTTDMTGDGIPDLVLHYPTSDATGGVGTSHWDVFAGGPDGFADDPTAWSLPYAEQAFSDLFHVTTDMTGDGVPDLVVHYPTSDATDGVGATHWDVYPGGADGFADDPTAWSLPYAEQAFSDSFHVTTDMTGDGIPDLVLHYPSSEATDGVGTTHWDVYPGAPGGFDDDPIAWSLPYAEQAFADLFHVVSDMTGDGIPDLVLHYPTSDATDGVGTTHWDVYPGGPDGFADDPIAWSLPYAEQAFADLFHVVSDMTGDGIPDLVLHYPTSDATEGVGTSHWDVYPGGPDGFADDPTAWSLPYAEQAFADLFHVVSDRTGDGIPDRVLHYPTSDATEGVGTSHWDVYPGACDR
ncbi:MAG: hypothetical protein NXI35_03260 [bacterium]|nr:hypothetical protein [bacterium]